jgi:transcriptional regulator with XRE-family HTH domain
MSTNVEIGARLKSERQRIGLTQEELAFATSISKTSQVNYESGKRTPVWTLTTSSRA